MNEITLVGAAPSILHWARSLAAGAFAVLTASLLTLLGALPFLFAALVVVAGLFLIGRACALAMRTHYDVTGSRAIVRKGIFRSGTVATDLSLVLGVSVRSTQLQRQLGLGDVVLDCAGGELVFEGVEEPEKLRERILALR